MQGKLLRFHVLLASLLCTATLAKAQTVAVDPVPSDPGPYVSGQVVVVEVYISQDSGSSQLLRFAQVDLNDTDPELLATAAYPSVGGATIGFWDFTSIAGCPGLCGVNHNTEAIPIGMRTNIGAVTYLGFVANSGEQILLLDSTPVRIGLVEVTMPNGSGPYTLDVVGSGPAPDEGGMIVYGFGVLPGDDVFIAESADILGGKITFNIDYGSCCHPDGTCSLGFEVECDGLWTLNATCDPSPCPSVADVTAEGCRYLHVSLNPDAFDDVPFALLVTSPDWPCLTKYVALDSGIGRLIDDPVFRTAIEWGDSIEIADSELIPSSTYEVRVETTVGQTTPASTVLFKWGDVIAPLGGSNQPNFSDISSLVSCFQASPNAPPLAACDIEPAIPDQDADFADINACVGASMGTEYPFVLPCP